VTVVTRDPRPAGSAEDFEEGLEVRARRAKPQSVFEHVRVLERRNHVQCVAQESLQFTDLEDCFGALFGGRTKHAVAAGSTHHVKGPART